VTGPLRAGNSYAARLGHYNIYVYTRHRAPSTRCRVQRLDEIEFLRAEDRQPQPNTKIAVVEQVVEMRCGGAETDGRAQRSTRTHVLHVLRLKGEGAGSVGYAWPSLCIRVREPFILKV